MDECFFEDDFGAREVGQFEVGGGVFGDLFEEAGLELEEVVVDSGADDGEGVVHVCYGEERFTLSICSCDFYGVENGSIVVENSEKIIVITEEVFVFRG